MAKAAKASIKRKAANGYKLAEPLPNGLILQDISKKRWRLGPSIGQGGFGEIYSAQEENSKGSKYPNVIKIEPHANGPLFVEMHFYMRNAKPADIEKFKNEKGLSTFGMPLYLGSGSHDFKGEKYRFIVMEKFGTDLWKIFLENGRVFPKTTVFKVAIQILDVLEYIHNRGYIHADIKGANILMGATKETQNKQIYLVDFGLAAKISDDKDFKPNPKKAHDGTIEYLSRDAHQGVQTRRGDLEILVYNMIQWLGCNLPWESNLKVPNVVQKSKEDHMKSIPKLMKACFENKTPPDELVDFLKYLQTLEFNSKPDYARLRKIFAGGLDPDDGLGKPFQFKVTQKTPQKRKHVVNGNSEEDILSPDKVLVGRRGQPKVNYDESPGNRKRTKRKTPVKVSTPRKKHITGDTPGSPETGNEVIDEMAGFTPSMRDIFMKRKEKLQSRGKKSDK